jgi:uncharacterized membrane protein YcaP (DUF421 family)
MWEIAKDLHWWEFIARAVIVYGALLLLMRLGGKRQIGQMAPFDLVLLLLVSNAVQNAMNGGDNSVTAGLILAVTLVVVNFVVGMLVAKNKGIASFVEGQPQVLIHNGQVNPAALRSAELSMRDLEAALRLNGGTSIAKVHYAILETNGQISFHTKEEHEMIHQMRLAGNPRGAHRVRTQGQAAAAPKKGIPISRKRRP